MKTTPNSIAPFEITARVLFLSNKDFTDPTKFTKKIWDSGVQPLRNRCAIIGLPFDPLELYHYVGWLASNTPMLRDLYFDYKIGEPMPARNGGTVIAHKGNNRRRLSRPETEEVLSHFCYYAPSYPSISPRELVRFAVARIGKSYDEWAAQIAPLLTGTRDLPKDRQWFSVVPAKRAYYTVARWSRPTVKV